MVKRGLFNKKGKGEDQENLSGVKEIPIREFNVIDDLRDRYVITENKTSFTTGIKCIGLPLDKLTEVETKLIELSHLQFFNMLNWDMQMYIQSRQMNIQSNLEFINETKQVFEKELKKVDEKRKNILRIIEESPTRKDEYVKEIGELDKTYSCLVNQIKWKSEEIMYAQKVAAPGSPPQHDVYILYSYKHNPMDFTTNLTAEEIFHKATAFMETKINSSINALKRCSIECAWLTPMQIAEIQYRAYNLSDADIVPFDEYINTNTGNVNVSTFDLYTTTDYFQKHTTHVTNTGGMAV